MVKNKEQGQALLIIILVMVVALTVGLSFISRSIISLRTSREEATSQKALSAAEAGIEQVLKTNIPILPGTTLASPPEDTSTTYGATFLPVLGTEVLVNGGSLVPKDDGADIWLVAHDPVTNQPIFTAPWNGNLTIYWGDSSGDCNNAALEVAVIYSSTAPPLITPVLKRYAYDPCSTRRSSNNFSSPLAGGTVSGKTFPYSITSISITNGLVVRVVPLYKSAPIGVVGSIALPSQGTVIDSTGVSQGTSRKINVFKGYPQLPIQYFSYGLFSP